VRRVLTAALATALWGLPAAGAAQEPEPPPSAEEVEARALFDRGRQLAEERRFSEAAEAFTRSLALVDRPSTAFNLGTCLYALERYVEAIEVLDRFEPEPDDPDAESGRADAARMLAHARASVARILVEVVPEDAEVFVDGDALEGGGTRLLAVNPGPHVIRAEAPHHAPRLIEVDVAAGRRVVRAISLTSTRQPARLEVSLSDRPGAAIFVDGQRVGVDEVSLELEAGPHEVRWQAPDAEAPEVRRIELDWSERLRLAIESPPAAPTPLVEEPAFWAVGGGVLGAVAVAVVIGVLVAETAPQPGGGSSGVLLQPSRGSVEISGP